MEIILNKNKRAGLIGTLLFHLLLLLLFMYFGLTYQYPIPEQGIMINFGTSSEGMGEIQPEESGESSMAVEENHKSETSETEKSVAGEEVTTQEQKETISVNKTEKNEKKPVEEVQPKVSEELSQALNKFKNRNKTKAGEGETGKTGDQGDPNGSKEATSHTGGMGGDGFSFNMKGRKMLSKPEVKEKSQDEGKVVVDLVIDREGKVIRAKAGGKGTTYTQDAALWRKLELESSKIKFSPSDNPYTPEEQKGTVTFVFILE